MLNYAAALTYFPKLTYQRIEKLYRFFGRAEKIWQAEFDELLSAGFDSAVASEFIAWRDTKSVEKITAELEQLDVQTVAMPSEQYPALLKEITDPPRVLFFAEHYLLTSARLWLLLVLENAHPMADR